MSLKKNLVIASLIASPLVLGSNFISHAANSIKNSKPSIVKIKSEQSILSHIAGKKWDLDKNSQDELTLPKPEEKKDQPAKPIPGPKLPSAPVGTGDVTMDPVAAFNEIAGEYNLSQTERDQWAYIIGRESGWSAHATNPSSGAYGLAQSLPGSKMASAGADWQNNPKTQLKWMFGYMTGRYGSISGAYNFWINNHWY